MRFLWTDGAWRARMARAIAGALKALVQGPLKDKPVTVATTDATGGAIFATLSDLMAAAKVSAPEGAA